MTICKAKSIHCLFRNAVTVSMSAPIRNNILWNSDAGWENTPITRMIMAAIPKYKTQSAPAMDSIQDHRPFIWN